MLRRTQVSLTEEERRALDAVSSRTGQPISALIRHAVDTVYGSGHSLDDDLKAMQRAFGCWRRRDQDGETWVEQVRSSGRGCSP